MGCETPLFAKTQAERPCHKRTLQELAAHVGQAFSLSRRSRAGKCLRATQIVPVTNARPF